MIHSTLFRSTQLLKRTGSSPEEIFFAIRELKNDSPSLYSARSLTTLASESVHEMQTRHPVYRAYLPTVSTFLSPIAPEVGMRYAIIAIYSKCMSISLQLL